MGFIETLRAAQGNSFRRVKLFCFAGRAGNFLGTLKPICCAHRLRKRSGRGNGLNHRPQQVDF
jgi:hypothetical protein